jgi:DNA-binding response OmpR family regulator
MSSFISAAKMRILFVEDEEGVAHFIKKGLEEERYTVDHVANGEEGLELIRLYEYDLAVLDVMLPGISGMEVCSQIRKKGLSMPILLLTARDSVRDKVLGLDSGADDYLTKPFSFDELLARVRALMRRKHDSLVELRYQELRIDTLSHRVFVKDQEVLLSPKEYNILLFLLRNKGRVVSRTRILENVWGYDFNPNTNVVDVHIKSLREKIGEFIPSSFIRSVRGVGYVLDKS